MKFAPLSLLLLLPSLAWAVDVVVDIGTADSAGPPGSPANTVVDVSAQLSVLANVSQVRVVGLLTPNTPSWSNESAIYMTDAADVGTGLSGWGTTSPVSFSVDFVRNFDPPIPPPVILEFFELLDDAVTPDAVWTDLSLTFSGAGPVQSAVDFAVAEGNAAFGSTILRENAGKARFRPSNISGRMETIRGIGLGDGCDPITSVWAGAYGPGGGSIAADGMTNAGGTVSGNVFGGGRHIGGTVDALPFGDNYEKVSKNGKVLFNNSTAVVAGHFLRKKGRTGLWYALEGDCPSGDTLYTPWLGSAPYPAP